MTHRGRGQIGARPAGAHSDAGVSRVGEALGDGLGAGLAEPLGDGLGVAPATASCGASAWARLIAVSSRFWASP